MNLLKQCLIAGIFVLCTFAGYAQDEILGKVPIPPSPNAAHLGTYGSFQMNKSTGSADVSIPVVTLSDGGITIPVTLSYQSAGLRVEERPSWVGMGWVLSAGGVITRTMRGRFDDQDNGFFRHLTAIPRKELVDYDLTVPSHKLNMYTRLDQISKNIYDYQPDAFSFNFCGHGGSFYFGNDHKVFTTEYSNLRFEPVYGVPTITTSKVIVGWKVWDQNGLVYNFNAYESTRTRSQSDTSIPEYISAWYLTSIKNPITGAEAFFTYDPVDRSYEYTENLSPVYSYKRNPNTLPLYYNLEGISWNPITSTHKHVKFLQTITLGNQKLTFTNAASSEPFRKLVNIQWESLGKTRDFAFTYDYFEGSDRLRLLSLTKPDNEKYFFEYYPGNLPSIQSNSQDHFGYYNGKTNSSLVPTVSFNGDMIGGGADRSVDFASTLMGMLKSIEHPTKGKSTFVYEQNTFKSELTHDDPEAIKENYSFEVFGTGTNGEHCGAEDIAVSPAANVESKFTYEFTFFHDGILDGRTFPTLEIRKANGDLVESKLIKMDTSPIKGELELDGGLYVIRACAYGDQHVGVSYKLTEVPEGEPYARKTGGLRVSRIENYNGQTGQTEIKSFGYGFNGYLVSEKLDGKGVPSYTSFSISETSDGYSTFTYYNVAVSSFPTGGLGPSSMPVAYEKVTEWIGTSESNAGWTETTFQKELDRISGSGPQISKQSVRSKVDIEKHYNSSGVLQQTVDYNYEALTNLKSVKGFVAKRVRTTNPFNYTEDFETSNYEIFSDVYRVSSKKTTTYTTNGPVEDLVTYTYDPDHRHTNIVSETKTDSEGNQLSTNFQYALDVIPCADGCRETFDNAMEGCENFMVKHALEATACSQLYDGCYLEFTQCMVNSDRGSNWCLPGGPDCGGTLLSCLESSGYNDCIESMQGGADFEACQKHAIISYTLCQDNAVACALDQGETGSTSEARAIGHLVSRNFVTTPLQVTQSKGTTQVKKTTLQVGMLRDSIPVKRTLSVSYNGGGPMTEITVNQHDVKGNPTEIFDRKDGFVTSYVWGYGQSLLIGEFKNAPVSEVGYSSFETSSNEGGLSFTRQISTGGKTGLYAHKLWIASITKTGLSASRRYTVSFWAKSGTPAVNGQTNTALETGDDGWSLYEHTVTNASTITISGTGSVIIDELRIAPEDAIATTFTHDVGSGVKSSADTNNKITYYDYYDSGKLMTVTDHYHDIMQYIEYHFRTASYPQNQNPQN